MTHPTPVTLDSREAMEQAYARGDHQTARALASALLRDEASEVREAAIRVRRETEPDRVIELVALVGLGAAAWLVIHYGG